MAKHHQEYQISLERAQKVAAVWDKATSLREAMSMAGINIKDMRTLFRYRRHVEQILGITLETHKKNDEQTNVLI